MGPFYWSLGCISSQGFCSQISKDLVAVFLRNAVIFFSDVVFIAGVGGEFFDEGINGENDGPARSIEVMFNALWFWHSF